MKKPKNQYPPENLPLQNPVAKFAHRFNKSQAYGDKTQYRRNGKHRKQEASANIFIMRVVAEVFCFGFIVGRIAQ